MSYNTSHATTTRSFAWVFAISMWERNEVPPSKSNTNKKLDGLSDQHHELRDVILLMQSEDVTIDKVQSYPDIVSRHNSMLASRLNSEVKVLKKPQFRAAILKFHNNRKGILSAAE